MLKNLAFEASSIHSRTDDNRYIYTEREDILHLMYECNHTHNLFSNLAEWLVEKGYENLRFSRLDSVFGMVSKEPRDPLNICLLIARFFIWYCRCTKTPLKFQAFLKYLRFYVQAIKASSFIRGQEKSFHEEWASLLNWIHQEE